jgi:hypothetical protein
MSISRCQPLRYVPRRRWRCRPGRNPGRPAWSPPATDRGRAAATAREPLERRAVPLAALRPRLTARPPSTGSTRMPQHLPGGEHDLRLHKSEPSRQALVANGCGGPVSVPMSPEQHRAEAEALLAMAKQSHDLVQEDGDAAPDRDLAIDVQNLALRAIGHSLLANLPPLPPPYRPEPPPPVPPTSQAR